MRPFKRYIEESQNKLILERLRVLDTQLSPIMSKRTIDYHYHTLANNYVVNYNKGKGDKDFNFAGAYLHNLFFPQLKRPDFNNKPNGISQQLIDSKFQSFDKFKQKFEQIALSIQGSGWIYLDTAGEIKTIENHKVVPDIAVLIDWWEHAWALDYQADKKQYLENIWTIIDWSIVNDRIIGKTK